MLCYVLGGLAPEDVCSEMLYAFDYCFLLVAQRQEENVS